MIRGRPCVLVSVLVLAGASHAAAQEPPAPPPRTIHAVRVVVPLQIDGRLDEEFYATHPATSDFVQIEPEEGAPATEKTDVWIAFDDDNVYVVVPVLGDRNRIAWSRRKCGGTTAACGRATTSSTGLFDTFLDRRNGFEFGLNSIGGRQDAQMANERQWIGDWNTIWDFSAGTVRGRVDGRSRHPLQVPSLQAR